MILPTKHVPLPDTYLGIGGVILAELSTPRTVLELWKIMQRKKMETLNTERFYLTLDFLYMLKLITFTKGLLHRSEVA
jgi:hypothetical protein